MKLRVTLTLDVDSPISVHDTQVILNNALEDYGTDFSPVVVESLAVVDVEAEAQAQEADL